MGRLWHIYAACLQLARWAGSHGGFIYCWLGGRGLMEDLFTVG